MTRLLVLAVLILSLTFAPAVFAQQPVSDGFAIQTNISTSPQAIDDDLFGFYTIEGGLLLGYKMGGTILSLGFSFGVFSDGSKNDQTFPGEPTEFTRTYYHFIVGPEVQFSILRSADQRAEMFGLIALGIGTWDSFTTTVPDNSPADTDSDETRISIRWRAAPGLRYWLHSNMAVGLAAGITGEHRLRYFETGEDTLSVYALFAQIGFLGAF